MNTKIETKKDGKEFERFDDFLRKVIAVPKEEINKREREEKHKNEAKKKARHR